MSKIDCSITENYIREKSRMLGSNSPTFCTIKCSNCPYEQFRNEKGILCTFLDIVYPEEAIKIVQKWSDEHSRMTMLDKFKEQHPNAPMNKKGGPVHSCPYHIGYEEEKDKPCKNKNYKCSDCWNRPYEENDDD